MLFLKTIFFDSIYNSKMKPEDNKQKQHKHGSALLEFLGSMYLAITLLMTVAIASVIGTVLLQNQPYNEYRTRFGDFWFEMFEMLGLYDVYTTGWFLLILAFLVLSTSVCVYRNTPTMLREMKNFRLHAKRKSLLAFHHKEEFVTQLSSDEIEEKISSFLTSRGYLFRRQKDEEHIITASMKGRYNKIGYILTHVSIILICIGGLIDGNVGLKWKVMNNQVKPLTDDMVVSDVPLESRLKPGDSLSFRGNRSIPEGSKINTVVLDYRDGYVLQELPFAIEVKDFRIEYYPTGQPKSFQSDLIIHDDKLDKPIEKTIAVNHPLIYRGYAVYQATFGDGGSIIDITAWPLNKIGKAQTFQGEIFNSIDMKSIGIPYRMELTDFRMFNINPVTNDKSEKKFKNSGPSYAFKLRDTAGEAYEYINYMQPLEKDGRWYMRSDIRKAIETGFQSLWIPLDKNNSIERFMTFRQMMLNKETTSSVIETLVQATFKRSGSVDRNMKTQLRQSMQKILHDYNNGELNRIVSEMAANMDEKEFFAKRAAYLSVVENILVEIYERVLNKEGIDTSSGINDPFDQQFFNDAFIEMGAIPTYASPFFFQLSSFKQIEATGLQISRAPGKDLVYLGCVMLIAGVFIMFYMHHKRVWFYMTEDNGQLNIILAAASNRNTVDFDNDFEKLKSDFGRLLKIV